MIIRGNTVGNSSPRADWNQTDPTKADYIKNKPVEDIAAAKKAAENALPKTGGAVSGDLTVGGAFTKTHEVNGSKYTLECGVGSDDTRGASACVQIRNAAGTTVARIDAWENGELTFRDSTGTTHDIFNGSRMIILTEGIHYGDELPAAGNPGRLFFKKV